MSRKVDVKYQVEYTVTIEVEDDEVLSDAVSDIDIPESALQGPGSSAYVSGSFEALSVSNAETGENLFDEYQDDEDEDGLGDLDDDEN